MPTGIIEVQDEVNVRFRGVPKYLIEEAAKSVTWHVPGFPHMPAYRSGRWDGTVSLLSTTGKSFLNLLDRVLPVFEDAGYEFEIEDSRHDWSDVINQMELPSDDIFAEYQWPNGNPVMLRDYQLNAVHAAIENGQGLLEMATGAGKASSLTSKIMTPAGYTLMGDINVGDVVSTIDGKTTEVTGVFPQGIKTKYEIEFQDGRVVECCDEHLWWVYDKRLERHAGKTGMDRFEVMPAKTIKKILDDNSATSLQIPLTPTYHNEKNLSVDPYVLGAMLGDGGMSGKCYSFMSMDNDIVERISASLLDGDELLAEPNRRSGLAMAYRLRNITNGTKCPHLKTALVELGLDKTLSDTKFIPVNYLYSSIEQRYALLQGLMDTGGYVSPKKGTTSYTSVSKQLALDVQQLIRSLGGIATIREKQGKYEDPNGNGVVCKIAYNVNFQIADPTKVVWCDRKSAIVRKTHYSDGLALRIVEVREAGVDEMQCISVADPTRVYITDNYTVTHNTLTCAAISKVYAVHGKVVLIVPNIDLAIQTQALFKMLGLDPGIWYGEMKDARDITITTWQSLDHFPELMADVVCVIVDEAHQAKSKVLSDIMIGPASNVPFRFGCTGTVPKEDLARYQIFSVIGKPIFQLKAWELQQKGVLASSDVIQLVMKDTLNPRYQMASSFDEWSEQLDWMFADPDRLEMMADIIREIAEEEGNVLILVPYRKHGKALEERLEGSVSLDGKDSPKKRRKMYEWFNDNDNNVLICTFGIASTGLDIPRIKVLCFIEPGKKFEKVIQTVGRGLRKASDKDHVSILDIVGDTDFSKAHAAERRRHYKEAKIDVTQEEIDYANS